MNTKPIKNILYVENGIGYGGAIICLRHLIRHLDRSRFNPLVVTGRTGPHYREIAQEAQWQYIPDRHIDVIALRAKLNSQPIPGLGTLLNQMLARADDVFNFLPFFLRLLWTAWRGKVDLIHANNEPLCNRAALLVGKLLHIPTVCHVRGDQSGSRLMRWAFSLPNHFISVSHWVSKSMQDNLQVSSDKISVIYDGIALEALNVNVDGNLFRTQHHIPNESFAVGLVGLLIPWKGQELFLDAAKLLRDKIPHLKMLIIGGTPDDCVVYEAKLRQRISEEGLENIVSFTGHVSDMAVVYNGLNVVVSASTSPEPLGTVVIESMAMGRALIGPNHGGAAEMMTHNHTGLLFTPHDSTSLAEQIERFYHDPELMLRLGQQAREHALATFSVATHANKIEAVYDTLLP